MALHTSVEKVLLELKKERLSGAYLLESAKKFQMHIHKTIGMAPLTQSALPVEGEKKGEEGPDGWSLSERENRTDKSTSQK